VNTTLTRIIGKLLQERLTGPNSLALPYTFDVRGGGGFWGVEFDFTIDNNNNNGIIVDFKGESFAMLVQARALQNGLIVIGMVGGANLEGTKGDHIILAPAYNVTKEEIEKIVDIFVNSVEEILREFGVQ
jgi:adenosylmethionine-8-amino-7-oxononanoate aminotransferase